MKNNETIDQEIWKDIVGYEGRYQVSTLGSIRSSSRIVNVSGRGSRKKNGRLMRASKYGVKGRQYLGVALYNSEGVSKAMRVHRAVAITFIPNPENKSEINHIDGNKYNNKLSNLEWVTAKENIRHAWDSGLAKHTKERKEKISKSRSVPVYKCNNDNFSIIEEYKSIKEAAIKNKCAEVNIRYCLRETLDTFKGCKWILKSKYITNVYNK